MLDVVRFYLSEKTKVFLFRSVWPIVSLIVVPVAPRAAAIENPRLMIVLIAVIDTQKMNGTVIRNPLM